MFNNLHEQLEQEIEKTIMRHFYGKLKTNSAILEYGIQKIEKWFRNR